jgi:hypothetical protein
LLEYWTNDHDNEGLNLAVTCHCGKMVEKNSKNFNSRRILREPTFAPLGRGSRTVDRVLEF